MTPELKTWLDGNDMRVATLSRVRGLYEVRLWDYPADGRNGPHGEGKNEDSDHAERIAVLDWQRKEEDR